MNLKFKRDKVKGSRAFSFFAQNLAGKGNRGGAGKRKRPSPLGLGRDEENHRGFLAGNIPA